MNNTRKYTYLDLVAARELGPEAINEVSLSRIWQHTQKAGEKSFGIITAYRGAFPKRENIARNGRLKQDLRSAGLGFAEMTGHWQECQDAAIPWQDCPKELLSDVTEESLFVPGITLDLINRLGKKNDQDAWVYAGADTQGDVMLMGDAGPITNLGSFHPGRIAQAYSKLKGSRTFIFEARAGGFMEGLIEREARRGSKFEALQARVEELRAQFDPTVASR